MIEAIVLKIRAMLEVGGRSKLLLYFKQTFLVIISSECSVKNLLSWLRAKVLEERINVSELFALFLCRHNFGNNIICNAVAMEFS